MEGLRSPELKNTSSNVRLRPQLTEMQSLVRTPHLPVTLVLFVLYFLRASLICFYFPLQPGISLDELESASDPILSNPFRSSHPAHILPTSLATGKQQLTNWVTCWHCIIMDFYEYLSKQLMRHSLYLNSVR